MIVYFSVISILIIINQFLIYTKIEEANERIKKIPYKKKYKIATVHAKDIHNIRDLERILDDIDVSHIKYNARGNYFNVYIKEDEYEC